jgi:kelch-like protein 12
LRKLKVPNEEVVYNCVLRRLKVPNEEVVFNCVFNWINFDKKNREQYLPKLMVYVRLPFLSPQFLTDVCDKEIMIKKSFECRDMLDEAKKLYFRRRAEMSGIRIGKDEYLV